MKRINKLYMTAGMVVASGLLFGVAAHADEFDQATTITFSAPVDIPGHVLPAGTYLFRVPDSDTGSNLVEIFNTDGTKLYATVPTIPTVREQSNDKTVVTLATQGSGEPDALMKWFYPGRLTGQRFLYRTGENQRLVRDQHVTVAATETTKSTVQAGD